MTKTVEAPPLLQMIPVKALAPHPGNVRRNLGDLTELSRSVKSSGILEPLLVLPESDGSHLVVAGHRRLAAARKAGLTVVPCIVRDLGEAEVIEAMLTENLQRAEISPVEEALAYARLVELEVTVKAIATKVGRSQTHVKNRLDLVALPEPVLALVESRDVSLSDAGELTRFVDDEAAMEVLAEHPDWPVWRLENHMNQLARDKAMEVEREKLAKAGIAEFKPVNWYPPWQLPLNGKPAPVALLELGKAWSKHRLEPCHAVRLTAGHGANTGSVERMTICTDPRRHTTLVPEAGRSVLQIDPGRYSADAPDGSQDRAVDPESRKFLDERRAETEAREAASAARQAHAAGLLDNPDACPLLPPLVVAQILATLYDAEFPDPRLVYDLMFPAETGETEAVDAWLETLVYGDDEAARPRIAWAALFASAEEAGYNADLFWLFHDTLVASGYAPHPYELDQRQVWEKTVENRRRLRADVDVDALELDDGTWDILVAAKGAPQLIVPGSAPAVADLEAREYATSLPAPAEGEGMVRLHFTALGRKVSAAVADAHHQKA